MAIQIESELKDILLKIDQKLAHLQTDLTDVKISITEIKKDNQRLEEKIDNTSKRLEEKIDTTSQRLEEKIDNTDKKIDTTAKSLENKIDATNKNLTDNFQNLGKRVDNSEFINRSIFIGLILTVLGGFAKFIGLIGNS